MIHKDQLFILDDHYDDLGLLRAKTDFEPAKVIALYKEGKGERSFASFLLREGFAIHVAVEKITLRQGY